MVVPENYIFCAALSLQVLTKSQTQIEKIFNMCSILLTDKSIFLKCTFELRIIIDFLICICKQISP